ncbi:MAG: hypothetical protein DRH08_00250 [Deltaproteobacteria bacterium]|nr:MAG: hypothetical protein DRH08_00250 [Deltaproteobacteria bacterium]
MKRLPISVDSDGLFLDLYRLKNGAAKEGPMEENSSVLPSEALDWTNAEGGGEPIAFGTMGDGAFCAERSGVFGAPVDAVEGFCAEADSTPSHSYDGNVLKGFLEEIVVRIRSVDSEEADEPFDIGPMIAPTIQVTETGGIISVTMDSHLARLLTYALRSHRFGHAILMQCEPVAKGDLGENLDTKDEDDGPDV